MNNSYNEFEDMLNELSNKKIGELSIREISKYLLLAEELDWVDTKKRDDKIFKDYNKNLLENLSYILEDSIFRLINEEILYNYDLHTIPMDLEYN